MSNKSIPRLADYKAINVSDLDYLVYSSLIPDIQLAVDTYASGRVLDIGCGNKPYEKIFEGKITEYIGCDIAQSDRNMVDILCEADNIPLPANSFDTIFSTQVIEHITNHGGMISEAYRLLKPGGYFILSGPMYWPLHEEPHDYFRFTENGFKFLLTSAGFEIKKIKANGGAWATAGQSYIHAMINSKSKNLLIRLRRFIFLRLKLYKLHNIFYNWLDKKDHNPVNTMNYVVIGKKPVTERSPGTDLLMPDNEKR